MINQEETLVRLTAAALQGLAANPYMTKDWESGNGALAVCMAREAIHWMAQKEKEEEDKSPSP